MKKLFIAMAVLLLLTTCEKEERLLWQSFRLIQERIYL